MALPESYLVTTKNLEAIFNAIQGAQAPEKFTAGFLENLDFTSSNDRLYLRFLKDLGFLTPDGSPTDRYHAFLDPSEARKVLAGAIKETYSDLFAINKNAQTMSVEDLKGKLKTLTRGKKSENVINWMANTFKALADYADWSAMPKSSNGERQEEAVDETPKAPEKPEDMPDASQHRHRTTPSLHYNIQIHLPESRDPAVFDAIFQAMKKHLI